MLKLVTDGNQMKSFFYSYNRYTLQVQQNFPGSTPYNIESKFSPWRNALLLWR